MLTEISADLWKVIGQQSKNKTKMTWLEIVDLYIPLAVSGGAEQVG
jgi:hypothetical protein